MHRVRALTAARLAPPHSDIEVAAAARQAAGDHRITALRRRCRSAADGAFHLCPQPSARATKRRSRSQRGARLARAAQRCCAAPRPRVVALPWRRERRSGHAVQHGVLLRGQQQASGWRLVKLGKNARYATLTFDAMNVAPFVVMIERGQCVTLCPDGSCLRVWSVMQCPQLSPLTVLECRCSANQHLQCVRPRLSRGLPFTSCQRAGAAPAAHRPPGAGAIPGPGGTSHASAGVGQPGATEHGFPGRA